MDAGTVISYSDFSSIITNLTNQFSVSTIVGILGQAVILSVGFVFMWWGVRKIIGIIMKAVKKGKAGV